MCNAGPEIVISQNIRIDGSTIVIPFPSLSIASQGRYFTPFVFCDCNRPQFHHFLPTGIQFRRLAFQLYHTRIKENSYCKNYLKQLNARKYEALSPRTHQCWPTSGKLQALPISIAHGNHLEVPSSHTRR